MLISTPSLPGGMRVPELRAPHATRRASFLPLLLGATSPLLPRALQAAQPAIPQDQRQVFRSPSGLRFVDFVEGSGPTPRYGQLIRFHYVAQAPDTTFGRLVKFDSTYERKAPYLTKHGNGLTCEGIEEALHTMRAGGRRRVIVPSNLGYTSDKGPMPPNNDGRVGLFQRVTDGEPLVFDLELVSVMDDLVDRGDYDDETMISKPELKDFISSKDGP